MNVTAPTDVDLVAASLRGDRGAFGQLVERYQAMVCAVAYSVLGELAASEDAAQEAFLAAWKQLATLHEPDRVRAWLAGIARNIARAGARKRQHEPTPLIHDIAASPATPPDVAAADREEETILWRVLEEIPERYREPLVLYYREHQSVAEVAETMNISEDAVKQRLARGRQALKGQVAAFVESTLRKTGPKAAFTAGVLAALNTTGGPAAAAGAGGAGAAAGLGVSAGVLGGILGSLIGIAGGVFGTACSIKNTRTPAERALMVKAAWAAWIYTTLLVGAFLYVSFTQRWLFENAWFQVAFWTLHATVLLVSIPWLNRKARALEAPPPV